MFNTNFLIATITAASISIDSDITDVNSTLMEFLEHVSSVEYNVTILLANIMFLSICFLIRYFSYFKIVDIDTSDSKGKKLYSRYRSYVISHIFLSMLFAFIICCILVMLVNSNISIIWNVIISPLIGFLSSIWFDNEILANYEAKYKILKNPLNDKKDDEDKKDKDEDDPHIVVNINNNTDNEGTDDKFVLTGDKTLPDDKKLEATINRIIEVQKEQSILLETHTEELKNQNEMLKSMQTLMKNNIKFELEDMIYAALDRGYVTPAEDRKIRVKYRDYRDNNGNGDLEELYKSRYLDLDVHEHNKTV